MIEINHLYKCCVDEETAWIVQYLTVYVVYTRI